MESFNGVKDVIEKRSRLAQIYLIFTTLFVPSLHPILSYSLSIRIPTYKITEMQTNTLLPFFIFIIFILCYSAILSKKSDLLMRDLWIVDINALLASISLSLIIALPASLVGAAYYDFSYQLLLSIILIILLTVVIGWSLIIIPRELKI